MPIPIIIWIAALVIGGATVAAYWDDITIYFKGKSFAILGAKATGKTTLHNFLSQGTLTGGTGMEKTEKNILRLKDLNLVIKSSIDITGSEDFVPQWKTVISQANFVFYLINSSKVYNQDQDYIKLVKFHLAKIAEILKEIGRRNEVVYIICSFTDLITNESDSNRLRSHLEEIIKNALLELNEPPVVFVGNLNTEQEKEKLVTELFKTIKTKSK